MSDLFEPAAARRHHDFCANPLVPPIPSDVWHACRAAFGTENERDDRALYLGLIRFREYQRKAFLDLFADIDWKDTDQGLHATAQVSAAAVQDMGVALGFASLTDINAAIAA